MATLTITLPDDRIALLREQAEASGAPVDAYIDGLLSREARTRAAKKRLEALLLEGLSSGPPIPVTPETWDEIRREVKERRSAKRKAQ